MDELMDKCLVAIKEKERILDYKLIENHETLK